MKKEELKRHIIVILALNQVGALARIISVFGRRSFNIETITASPSNYPGLTRITIIITATDSAMDQVLAQVEKVELVKKVFTPGENTLYRELLLLKINAKGEDRERAMSVINVYRGRVVDLTSESMVIEVTGSPQKIGGFIDIMNEFDVVEICRTGATGIEVPGRTFDII